MNNWKFRITWRSCGRCIAGKSAAIGTMLVPHHYEVITAPLSLKFPRKFTKSALGQKPDRPEYRFADKSSSADIILAESASGGSRGGRKSCNFLSRDAPRRPFISPWPLFRKRVEIRPSGVPISPPLHSRIRLFPPAGEKCTGCSRAEYPVEFENFVARVPCPPR